MDEVQEVNKIEVVEKKKFKTFQVVISDEIRKVLDDEKAKLNIKTDSKLGLLMIEKYFKS